MVGMVPPRRGRTREPAGERWASGPVVTPDPRLESTLPDRRQSLAHVCGVLAVYLTLAVAITWPTGVPGSGLVPGAQRSDLYNSLWSMWFFQDAVWSGLAPFETELLDHPAGGSILIADVPAGVWATVLVPLLGLPGAYTALVLWRLMIAGAAAHGLAREWLGDGRAAFVAGVAVETAPVVLSGVHNGTSEAFSVAAVALAAWAALRVVRGGGWPAALATGGALLLSAFASGYAAAASLGFVTCILGLTRGEGSVRLRLAALGLGLLLVLPWARVVVAGATEAGTLVGIKHARELAGVRRTTGAADPRGWLAVGGFRSPDFREISRYDEQFIHCHYLGWAVFLLGIVGLSRRREGRVALAMAGVGGLVLAMGPVVTIGGAPWVFGDERALPLPYFVVERLPGFSSLSLLWRLGLAPALALGLGGAAAVAGRPRLVPAAIVAILIDGALLSPLGRPGRAPTTIPAGVEALGAAPDGAVLNFPVVGGRGYLYEQTAHRKPVAGTLNFPNNIAGRRVWRALAGADPATPDAARVAIEREARAAGVRYLVVHPDPLARPDMHDAGVAVARALYDPLSEPPGSGPDGPAGVEVYALW